MKLIILILLCLSSPIYAFDCKKDKICNKIYALMHKKDAKEAIKLTNMYKIYGKIYNIDPNISIAIAKQESNLNNKQHRSANGIIYNKICLSDNIPFENCIEGSSIVKMFTDIGIFQIHVNTIIEYNLDPVRLKNDLDYAFNWHFKILKKKITECKNKKNAWGCYHSKTPSLKQKYVKLVTKHL